MPVFRLDDRVVFPRPDLAEDDGLLAVGGDLRPERLLLAYANGIFPWYHDELPILWHSPDPRMVLCTSDLHVSRSLAKTIRRHRFSLRLDTAFEQVIDGCAAARDGEPGTWITDDMREAYLELFRLGFAHSAEAWVDGELAGGVYGVSLGGAFFGESMFARVSDASKVTFVALVRQLSRWHIDLIDCQVYTDHLASFGAQPIPRAKFLAELDAALDKPTLPGRWCFDADMT
ncbi:MAG TPA: leucyl/phenylalanyl-tRNA--protein transferase [Kofleriaceae bacterium]|nr:leucyl/phenylalanyl-tRNA--protein transferase [Kofleriaceae bacterium]